jgi:hypothetical protein
MKKKIGVIIQFDDIEYSEAERDYYWGRFAYLLSKAAQRKEENKNAECFNFTNSIKQKENVCKAC